MKRLLLFAITLMAFGIADSRAQMVGKGAQYVWNEFQAGDSLLLANATGISDAGLPEIDLDNTFLSCELSRRANYWNGRYTLGVLNGPSEDNVFILVDAPNQKYNNKDCKSFYLQHAYKKTYVKCYHGFEGDVYNQGTAELVESIDEATSFHFQNAKSAGASTSLVNANTVLLTHYESNKPWYFGPFANYSFIYYGSADKDSWNAYKIKWVYPDAPQYAVLTTNKAVGEEMTFCVDDLGTVSVDWGDGEWMEYQSGEITGEIKGSDIVIKGTPYMTSLDCSNCGLTGLNIDGMRNLINLQCANNELTAISLEETPKLLELDIAGNQFSGFSYEGDVLEYLDCSNNNLSTLSVTKITGLQHLYCGGNKLSKLNVSRNKLLKTLWCQDNSITSLDFSACTEIQSVYASRNKLTKVTAPENCTSLVDLWCDDNVVANLTVSGAAPITLNIANNLLETLDIKKPNAGYKPYLLDQSNNHFCLSDIYSAKYITNYFIEPQAKVQVDFEEIPVGEVIDFTKYMKNANNVACDIDFYTEGGRKLIAGNEGVGDYFKRGVNITFWTAFPSIYFKVTHEQYPGFASVSLPFMVGDGSGVCEVQSDGMKQSEVYTVGGMKVQNTENLPQGIYIINGKKVVK